jgi:hypothetical protein
MLRHDSLRQLNLNQLTHLSRGERPPNRAEKAILASCCVKRLLHDSMRQLNLKQMIHLSREGDGARTEAEEAIWHLAASDWLLHDSVRQLKFESGLGGWYRP